MDLCLWGWWEGVGRIKSFASSCQSCSIQTSSCWVFHLESALDNSLFWGSGLLLLCTIWMSQRCSSIRPLCTWVSRLKNPSCSGEPVCNRKTKTGDKFWHQVSWGPHGIPLKLAIVNNIRNTTVWFFDFFAHPELAHKKYIHRWIVLVLCKVLNSIRKQRWTSHLLGRERERKTFNTSIYDSQTRTSSAVEICSC